MGRGDRWAGQRVPGHRRARPAHRRARAWQRLRGQDGERDAARARRPQRLRSRLWRTAVRAGWRASLAAGWATAAAIAVLLGAIEAGPLAGLVAATLSLLAARRALPSG